MFFDQLCGNASRRSSLVLWSYRCHQAVVTNSKHITLCVLFVSCEQLPTYLFPLRNCTCEDRLVGCTRSQPNTCNYPCDCASHAFVKRFSFKTFLVLKTFGWFSLTLYPKIRRKYSIYNVLKPHLLPYLCIDYNLYNLFLLFICSNSIIW
jgi:hypothetical protein